MRMTYQTDPKRLLLVAMALFIVMANGVGALDQENGSDPFNTRADGMPWEVPEFCGGRLPHQPILIDNEDGYATPGNGVVDGNGSESDPYIIEGWCIVGHGVPAGNLGLQPIAGINIQGTGSHVVIRDNVIVSPSRIVLDKVFQPGWGPPPYQYGIILREAENVAIISNLITNNEWDGIFLRYSKNNSIEGNTILESRNGIYLRASSHNSVSHNQIENMYSDGILVVGESDIGTMGLSEYNAFRNNTVRTTFGDGISLLQSDNNLIQGNSVSDAHGVRAAYSLCPYDKCSFGVWLRGSHNNNIKANLVMENGRGMSISASSDNVIEGNVIRDNAIYGFATPNGSERIIFSNNMVVGNFLFGVTISPFRENTVINNTITNNGGVGVEFSRGGEGNLVFTDNNIYGNGWLPYARLGISLQSSGVTFFAEDFQHADRLIDLSGNWWGDASGPSGNLVDSCTGLSTSGEGSMIRVHDETLQICFSPWAESADMLQGAG